MTEERRVMCINCQRGTGCPDFNEDGGCSAGILIIRDAIDLTCTKRMAFTRTAIERLRDPEGYIGYKIYDQIKAVTKAAEEAGIDWSSIHVTLQVWDKRYLQARADARAGGTEEKEEIPYRETEAKQAKPTDISERPEILGGIKVVTDEAIPSGLAFVVSPGAVDEDGEVDPDKVAKIVNIEEKLESVREFVLSRKYDIEMDIENYGMLKPVLNYFLEEAEA